MFLPVLSIFFIEIIEKLIYNKVDITSRGIKMINNLKFIA